ncbi:MAG: hypothetical protein HFJ47_02925 [Clostridia bacterium]|nr:hypothetical protein [Clostridia bacterium]
MKLSKDKKVKIAISLIIVLLAVIVIGIISRGIQTQTGLTTELDNVKDASVIQSNSTLTETSAEWAKSIGGDKNDNITSIVATRDGGYLVGGNFLSSSISLENNLGLTNSGSHDGMIIKYNSTGIAQWAKAIGGSGSDSISSVIETTNGDYVVVGYFGVSTINLGNGVSITNSNTSNGSMGMIIKYNSTGVAQWAKQMGTSRNDVF